jgi:hypothetical protein
MKNRHGPLRADSPNIGKRRAVVTMGAAIAALLMPASALAQPFMDDPPTPPYEAGPPPSSPPPVPPLGWVFYRYAPCADQNCSTLIVNVGADGLNVRVSPNGYPIVALVNGTPLIPLQRQADWVLVAPACDLTPTFAWSWTAGVSLARCWVWFP